MTCDAFSRIFRLSRSACSGFRLVSQEAPHYLIVYMTDKHYQAAFALFAGLFVSVFLLIFQPFGVSNYDPEFNIGTVFITDIAIFGIVVTVTIALSDLLLRRLVFPHPDRNQLIGWMVLDCIFVASTVFIAYNVVGGWHDFAWSSYFDFIRDITLVLMMPFAMFVFYLRHEFLKSEFTNFKWESSTAGLNRMLRFCSDNDKDEISVQLQDLLYLESQDNYVSVAYLNDAQVRTHLIRNSLKRLTTELQDTPLIRCHRSVIVNLARVTTCRQAGHGLSLALAGLDRPLTASRTYKPAVLAFLRSRRAT